MALSGRVAVKATSQNNLIFSWAAAQSVSANNSVISWQLLLEAKQYGRIVASPGSPWSVTVAGKTFSGTTSLAIENNQTKVLASGQVTLSHAADGSGSFDFTFRQGFYITFDGQSVHEISGSGRGELDTIPRASLPVAGDGILGSPMTIIVEGIDGCLHTLEYRFGNASGVIARDVTGSCDWTPPLSLAGQIPGAVSGTAVIHCATYRDGALLGKAQTTVKLTVPQSVVPTAEATWEDTSGAMAVAGNPVQNVSRLAVRITGTGIYGSSITAAAVQLDGKSYGGGCLTEAGAHSLQVSVTDSRGRTGSKIYDLTVVPYSPPALTIRASRCLEDGTADDTGSFAKLTVSARVAPVNGKNAGTLTVQWGGASESLAVGEGETVWEKLVEADPDSTMAISSRLEDAFAKTDRAMVLSTGYATLDLLAGGRGIAFGKAATREGFECAMKATFTGGVEGIFSPKQTTLEQPGWYRIGRIRLPGFYRITAVQNYNASPDCVVAADALCLYGGHSGALQKVAAACRNGESGISKLRLVRDPADVWACFVELYYGLSSRNSVLAAIHGWDGWSTVYDTFSPAAQDAGGDLAAELVL